MAVSGDGSRVYVGIIQEPGGVDVIDTASMQRVEDHADSGHDSQRVRDARRQYVVAGSIAAHGST